MSKFKETERICHWLGFVYKTHLLRQVKHITEVGSGDSNRISWVLALSLFTGKYVAVDLQPDTSKSPLPFQKKQFVNFDFFKLKIKSDLLIFDHSIDDILALVTLSILLGLAESGKVQAMQVSFVVFKAITFFALTIFIGQFIIPKLIRKLDDREAKTFTFALISALAVGYLAELAGLHLIIGAFLAGQFVRKEIIDRGFYQKINDRFYSLSYGFMAPIFFVSLSFHLHFQWKWPVIIFTITNPSHSTNNCSCVL